MTKWYFYHEYLPFHLNVWSKCLIASSLIHQVASAVGSFAQHRGLKGRQSQTWDKHNTARTVTCVSHTQLPSHTEGQMETADTKDLSAFQTSSNCCTAAQPVLPDHTANLPCCGLIAAASRSWIYLSWPCPLERHWEGQHILPCSHSCHGHLLTGFFCPLS